MSWFILIHPTSKHWMTSSPNSSTCVPVEAMQGLEGGWSTHPCHSLKTWCRLFSLCVKISFSEDHYSKLEDSYSKILYWISHSGAWQVESSRDQALVTGGPKVANDKGKQKDESPMEKEQSNEPSCSKRSKKNGKGKTMFLLWKGLSSRKLLHEKNNWWDGSPFEET